MSNIDYNLEKRTYTLYINSYDKLINTDHNNATFEINWAFLPTDYDMYKVRFSFQTTAGFYRDATYNSSYHAFSTAKIMLDLFGSNLSYDTQNGSQSKCLGYIFRDPQTSQSTTNRLFCSFLQNPPKTVARPNTNILNVKIINEYNDELLLGTNSNGTTLASDMTPWTMILEFIPIGDSKRTPTKSNLFGV